MTSHQANITRPVVIINRPVVIFPCNVSQMKRDSRRRIVVTTAKLLRRQGYNGTGLNQIVAEAEAPKGSLYFHFPGGKEQLAAEAIAASAGYLDAGLRACERASALESLDLYVEEAAKLLERTNYTEGCPIATVILEVGTSSALIGKACADAIDLQISHVTGWLERDGLERGRGSPPCPAHLYEPRRCAAARQGEEERGAADHAARPAPAAGGGELNSAAKPPNVAHTLPARQLPPQITRLSSTFIGGRTVGCRCGRGYTGSSTSMRTASTATSSSESSSIPSRACVEGRGIIRPIRPESRAVPAP